MLVQAASIVGNCSDSHGTYERAGLVTEIRAAPFTVTWPDIEEWVRVRWMPVVSESARADIERIMTRIGGDQRVRDLTLDHTESLLVGRNSTG